MKKIIFIGIVIIASFTSCEKLGYLHYVEVFNESSYDILIVYETTSRSGSFEITKDGKTKPELHTFLIHEEIVEEYSPKYSKEQFETNILNVEISIIEDGDTTLVPIDFEKFEYFNHGQGEDDRQVIHDYGLFFTDDMIE